MPTKSEHIEVIAIGASSGGTQTLTIILSNLKKEFLIPIVIVLHVEEFSNSYLASYLSLATKKYVKEAEEKEHIKEKVIYVAPASYHLLVEYDRTFSLNEDPRVNYARPSIDVFFESAADAYKDKIIGLLLTGANSDGAHGLKKIQDYGGGTLVQEPRSCSSSEMPRSALAIMKPDYVLTPLEISDFLNKIK